MLTDLANYRCLTVYLLASYIATLSVKIDSVDFVECSALLTSDMI